MDFFSSKSSGSPQTGNGTPLKTESEAIKAQLAKIQELAARNKQLTNEVTVLKAAAAKQQGSGLGQVPEVMAEMNKKDQLLQRMKSEAKQVIDSLKAKHQLEMDEARRGGSSTNSKAPTSAPSTPQGKGGQIAESPAVQAHVAALTTEMVQLKEQLTQGEDRLAKSEAKAAQAMERVMVVEEEMKKATEEFEVTRQWSQADLEAERARAEEEKARAEALSEQLRQKEGNMARMKEQARGILEANKAEKEAHEALKKAYAQLNHVRAGLEAKVLAAQGEAQALAVQVKQLEEAQAGASEQQDQQQGEAALREELGVVREQLDEVRKAAHAAAERHGKELADARAAAAKAEEEAKNEGNDEGLAARVIELESFVKMADGKAASAKGAAAEASSRELEVSTKWKAALERATALEAQVSVLEDEKKELSRRLSVMQMELEAMSPIVDALQRSREGLEASLAASQKQVQDLSAQVSTLQSRAQLPPEAKEQEDQGELEELRARLTAAVAEKQALAANITSAQESYLKLEAERDQIKDEREAIKIQVEATLYEKTALELQRDGLVSEREGMFAERDGLAKQVQGLVQERDVLVVEKDGVMMERDELKGLVHVLEDRISVVNADLEVVRMQSSKERDRKVEELEAKLREMMEATERPSGNADKGTPSKVIVLLAPATPASVGRCTLLTCLLISCPDCMLLWVARESGVGAAGEEGSSQGGRGGA